MKTIPHFAPQERIWGIIFYISLSSSTYRGISDNYLIPRICVSIFANSIYKLNSILQEAIRTNADLLEIRFDYISDLSNLTINVLENIVKKCKIPLIATNRRFEEGGYHIQAEDVRLKSLIIAAETGFQFVDVELATKGLKDVIVKLKDYSATPIISLHNFEDTPSLAELKNIVKRQVSEGAGICKLVTTAHTLTDNLRCLQLVSDISKTVRIVSFAMGKKGRLSRILSPFFGSEFTYSSLEDGLETASGQISVRNLKEIYHKLDVIN